MRGATRIQLQRGASRDRAGYTLVFCVLTLFGLLGLAALVIDLGMVRLAQRQMQTAADTAALEGLRYRDDPHVSAEDRDTARRQRARYVVAALFDDDLEPGNDDPMRHGAGPILHLEASQYGDPALDASRFIDLAASDVYKPELQLNRDNAQHGDIVAGELKSPDEIDPTLPLEDENYERRDFTPSDAGSGNLPPSLLVRLRRTNDFLGLDNLPGVSNSGPPLPLLFGRGGLTRARDPGEGYSLRHHGFTVRATAIADARPAMTVGATHAAVAGVATFAITSESFSDEDAEDELVPGDSRTLPFDASGTADPQASGPMAFPMVVGGPVPGIASFGQRVAATAGAVPADGDYVVPLVFGDPRGWWIVGFAFVGVSSDGPAAIVVTNRHNVRHIQHENASAALCVPVHSTVRDNSVLFGLLWAERSRLSDLDGLLLAPALAR